MQKGPRKRKIKRKEVGLRLHVRRRARERYGLRLVRADLDAMVTQIQVQYRAWYVKPQSNRKTHWLVQYAGTFLPVVYDKGRRELVTVLPPEVVEEYRREVGV